MTEPHDSAKTDADDAVPAADSLSPLGPSPTEMEADFVTDPFAFTKSGAADTDNFELPEPVLGTDEDGAGFGFGADDETAARPPFFGGPEAHDTTPTADLDAAGFGATDFDAPALDAPAACLRDGD